MHTSGNSVARGEARTQEHGQTTRRRKKRKRRTEKGEISPETNGLPEARRRRRQLGFAGAAGALGWELHAGLGAARAIPRNAWLWAVRWWPGQRISSPNWRREVARQASGTDAGTQVGGCDRCRAWAQRCTQGGAAARQRRPWPPTGGVDEAETRSGGVDAGARDARPGSGVVRRLPDEQLHAHFEKTS